MAESERWGVWGGETQTKPAHWLNAHTGTTLVFNTRDEAEVCALLASLCGLKFEARLFELEAI